MVLAKVIGTVVCTVSHPHYQGRRLLLVEPVGLPGQAPETAFVAVDSTHAGIGDTVLINREGNGARQVLKDPEACIISVIVGVVDSTWVAGARG